MSYETIDGDFRRPQQGKEENILKFDAEGGVNLDKIYLWGRISLQPQCNKGRKFQCIYHRSVSRNALLCCRYQCEQFGIINITNWHSKPACLISTIIFPWDSQELQSIDRGKTTRPAHRELLDETRAETFHRIFAHTCSSYRFKRGVLFVERRIVYGEYQYQYFTNLL